MSRQKEEMNTTKGEIKNQVIRDQTFGGDTVFN